jgi:hypothetical protein
MKISQTEAYGAALAEIAAVDEGTSTVTLLEANEPFSDVTVQTSNGWRFEFFNDGGTFDYFNWAEYGTHPEICRVESYPHQAGRPYDYPADHDDLACCECVVCRFSHYRPVDERKWGFR